MLFEQFVFSDDKKIKYNDNCVSIFAVGEIIYKIYKISRALRAGYY